MIERVTYECELCHTHYNTPGEAETCEALHILPEKDSIRFEYRKDEEYPRRVYIVFPDEKQVVFDVRGVV